MGGGGWQKNTITEGGKVWSLVLRICFNASLGFFFFFLTPSPQHHCNISELQKVMHFPMTLCPRSVNSTNNEKLFCTFHSKEVCAKKTKHSVLQIGHFCDVTKGPRWLSGISDEKLSKLGVWDLSRDDGVGPLWTLFCQSRARQPRTELWHLVDIFLMFECRLDLKGLVSGVSLSPPDNVRDHYNDNQASQSSCDNDWD